jgi:hypothetical protein
MVKEGSKLSADYADYTDKIRRGEKFISIFGVTVLTMPWSAVGPF